jgi:hypothetical protein
MKAFRLLPSLLPFLTGAAFASAEERVLLADTFESASNWTMSSTSGSIAVERDGRIFAHAPYAVVSGGVFHAELLSPVASDFTLSFDALHSRYSRTLFAGLLDASGRNGYGVRWSSGKDENQHSGNGAVSIVRFANREPSAASPSTAYYGDGLTPAVNSGHAATVADGLSFARVSLSWAASTRTLTLRVDGTVKGVVVDRSHGAFARVIIGGGQGSLFDNVELTVDGAAPAAR